MTKRRRVRGPARWTRSVLRAVRMVGVALAVAAVWRELRRPAAERTWNGALWGHVPYDLRRPTLARFRARIWDRESDHLLVPHAFGVGWTLNLHEAVARLRRLAGGELPTPQTAPAAA
ncbi:MAG TPA: DUF5808 domain-containing protein [Chloroflexota bacterium]|nr:DUF5808 domain-containing protein [Chloroflexota bacterium]